MLFKKILTCIAISFCCNAYSSTIEPDGTIIQRNVLGTGPGAMAEVISYASSGLIVAGLLCHPNDGATYPAIIHNHGGFGGIFENTEFSEGNIIETCINWAMLHNKVAFAPSYRGQDGGEGKAELCGGEADDVAAAAILLRSLSIVDPDRIAMVGGSVGGCVTLKASAKIPNLKVVVAFTPPTDWKSFVNYHRYSFTPTTETTCNGDVINWSMGGDEFADTVNTLICENPAGCSDEEYNSRSPLPALLTQSAPTLVMAAENDNVVPVEQQTLWSTLRSEAGNPVDVLVLDKCEYMELSDRPEAFDQFIYVPGASHSLPDTAITSGLAYLLYMLDKEE